MPLVMTFPLKFASLFLAVASIFSAFVLAVPSGSLPRSVKPNFAGGDKELLSLLASSINLADAPLLLPGKRTTTFPSSLTSDLGALTDNVKPFTSAELITVINEGIKTIRAQFPQAIATKIIMVAISQGEYAPITNPGFVNTFLLAFQSLQQRKQILQLGSLNTTTNTVRWHEPSSYDPVPFFPQPGITWPPSKLDVFEANEAKIAANITDAYITASCYYQYYFERDNVSGAYAYHPRLVYDFAMEWESNALISADTGKVLPSPVFPSMPKNPLRAGATDISLAKI